uniref:LEM-like domain-containing protein n=1 Tax=Panagrellus redivivus TaxID=6233 RepID=A0A7E5A0C6_PANRE
MSNPVPAEPIETRATRSATVVEINNELYIDEEDLPEIPRTKNLALIYYSDKFNPDEDYHVVTLDNPKTVKTKCLVITGIFAVIICVLLAGIGYTVVRALT